ncbi:MAG: hypothetical protein CSA33_02175 [Desulfobulbus propionicus]|nr:MAG: hypothetical protein CSA33_02175 [Desulfobulbus propionicus]
MKQVVIRDDDICACTRPDMLELLYRPLLDAGASVALSVIPAIRGGLSAGPLNGPFWKTYQLEYSPCLPPEQRALFQTFPLEPASEIVSYLLQNPGYEIVQHGYNHCIVDGLREGMLTDPRLISQKIAESSSIMHHCFGKNCDFFVVPWDDVSPASIKLLKQHFKGISLQRIGQRHVSAPKKMHAVCRRFMNDRHRLPYFWDGDFLLLEYPGPILSMFQDFGAMKKQIIRWLEQHDILVLVTHYWEFFWDWDQPNREFLDTWHDIAAYLLQRPDLELVRFSDLYKHLSA